MLFHQQKQCGLIFLYSNKDQMGTNRKKKTGTLLRQPYFFINLILSVSSTVSFIACYFWPVPAVHCDHSHKTFRSLNPFLNYFSVLLDISFKAIIFVGMNQRTATPVSPNFNYEWINTKRTSWRREKAKDKLWWRSAYVVFDLS